jgi:hypothetical protein
MATAVKMGHTGEGHAMATLDLLLGPVEIFQVLLLQAPPRTAGAHERDLALCTILLSEIGSLKLGIGSNGWKLVELELVDGGGGKGKEGKNERREDHGWKARRCGNNRDV